MAKTSMGMVLAVLLLAAGPVRGVGAEDDPLARATQLRDDASRDWAEGRHEAAAKKLAEAARIYDTVEGETPLDRAVTWRALVWNLVRAHDTAAALASYERLMALGAVEEGVRGEADAAFGAIWEAAARRETYEAARQTIDPVREGARAHGLPALQAQATHSLASLATKFGERATALMLLQEAITMRRSIGDAVGLGWSLNNLANLHLMAGAFGPALDPLAQAHALVHEERVAAVQSAVAWNLRKVIEELEKDARRHGPVWLRQRAKVAAVSGFGALLPASHLDREALRLATLRAVKPDLLALARELATSEDPSGISASAADVKLRAARAAITAGAPEEALRWVEALELGDGPCRPHLAARRALVRALAHARPGAAPAAFALAATAAATAWRDLGDFQGRRDALRDLVAAARDAGLEAAVPEILTEQEAEAVDGAPGGAGGAAQSGGDRSRLRDLPLDAAVFRIQIVDGRIRVLDQVADFGPSFELTWSPRSVALNGLSLILFGGYVVVKSFETGSAAVALGAPGATTLDALGVYMPLPGRGALLVQKNGALRYDLGR